MEEIWKKIGELITSDNIALLSVIITILIFIVSRYAELRYKKHDDKKVQYLKLIALLQKHIAGINKNEKGEKGKKSKNELSAEMKQEFFDTGASLLLYGSKKIYRQYILFREFTSNPLIKQCKYYKDDIILYIMADILKTMRKEVGLNFFGNISDNEAIGFFVNDISANPVAKEKDMDARFRIKMIRFELMMIDRTKFLIIKRLYNNFVRPIFGGIIIIIKHIVVIPVGRLFGKCFTDDKSEGEQTKQ